MSELTRRLERLEHALRSANDAEERCILATSTTEAARLEQDGFEPIHMAVRDTAGRFYHVEEAPAGIIERASLQPWLDCCRQSTHFLRPKPEESTGPSIVFTCCPCREGRDGFFTRCPDCLRHEAHYFLAPGPIYDLPRDSNVAPPPGTWLLRVNPAALLPPGHPERKQCRLDREQPGGWLEVWMLQP